MIIDEYTKPIDNGGMRYMYMIGHNGDHPVGDYMVDCFADTCMLNVRIYSTKRDDLDLMTQLCYPIIEEVAIEKHDYKSIFLVTHNQKLIKILTRDFPEDKEIITAEGYNVEGMPVKYVPLRKDN